MANFHYRLLVIDDGPVIRDLFQSSLYHPIHRVTGGDSLPRLLSMTGYMEARPRLKTPKC